MSISSLFMLFGAPLANNRWPWGAQRASDGAVFLRVWQDLKFIDGERRTHMLVFTPSSDDAEREGLGYQERARHVASVRAGGRCFMVMCSANDVEAEKRTIKEFDDHDIFIGGDIVETSADFHFPPKTGSDAAGWPCWLDTASATLPRPRRRCATTESACRPARTVSAASGSRHAPLKSNFVARSRSVSSR